MAVLPLPDVFTQRAPPPIAVFDTPFEFNSSARNQSAVFSNHETLLARALCHIATLSNPVVFE